ncbi:hypothetical protein [Nocardia sp. NBC_01327]|uniref:hypothetical protein n=1 Tax=Nocardia sp. NBC_01327 TaxID=2903593 RepID=UPI002E15B300|nr:hypothetical protein OG326_09790 [Nocardia sp. NBC_01327]
MTIVNNSDVLIPDRTRALHALRVAGWIGLDRFSYEVTPAGAALFKIVDTPRGELAGLTPAGEQAAQVELAAVCRQVDTAGRARILELLGLFEQADGRMKDVVTGFQRDRSAAKAAPLVTLFGEVADVIDALAAAFPLWDGYPARLRTAVQRIDGGELDYVASPLLDSFHTVWHLLHRDMRLVIESW